MLPKFSVFFFIILIVILLVSNGHALIKGRSISIEEDEELERELRAINKPAVKTIKTEYGDLYACVDIHKQNALDHPLLKNHKIKMRPSAALLNTLRTTSWMAKHSTTGTKPTKLGLEKGCPLGTVPIRRTTKEELIKAKSSLHKLSNDQISSSSYDFAGLVTNKAALGNQYHGIGAVLAIYQPVVNGDQSSAALIRVQAGEPGKNAGRIEAGWMVQPSLFGDNRTRFYAGWTQENNGGSVGCFNTYCPGFVAVSGAIPLGVSFGNVSTIEGDKYDVNMMLNLDPKTGDWWLLAEDDNKQIGYWPKELFQGLSAGAESAVWGGVAQTKSNTSPPMGSGIFQRGDYIQTSYMAQVVVRTGGGGDKFTAPEDSSIQATVSRCYQSGDNSFADPQWQYRFLFGGPGGTPETCK